MDIEPKSIASQIELIGRINTAIHLGRDENYKRAIDCMQRLMECRSEIAMRCRDFDLTDDTRDLYYELLEAYNTDMRKLLGL